MQNVTCLALCRTRSVLPKALVGNEDGGVDIRIDISAGKSLKMTNLVIDIGNTLTKIAVFRDNDLIEVQQYQQPGNDEIDSLLNKHHR
jgi:hypothetical protein